MFTVKSLPWISIPTVSLFLLELRGYSKLYDDIGDFPNGEWIPGGSKSTCAQKVKGYLKCSNVILRITPYLLFFVCLYVLFVVRQGLDL